MARIDVYVHDPWGAAFGSKKKVQAVVSGAGDEHNCGAPQMLAAATPRLPYTSFECIGRHDRGVLGTEVQIIEVSDTPSHQSSGTLFISEVLVLWRHPPPPPPPPHTPSAPPPPPSPPPRDAASAISQRFLAGRPSSVLAEAGVLVHMMDELEDPESRWDVRVGIDHMSASLIHPANCRLYHGSNGLVLAPDARLTCAWDHDSGTASGANLGCGQITGCVADDHPRTRDGSCKNSWAPSQLRQMLMAQRRYSYNGAPPPCV